MSMRPKKSAKDLPPKMLRRTKTLASGKLWVGYYYNGRDENGRRKEIPLGTDIAEAKRKWAELEGAPSEKNSNLMQYIFDRYEREVIPTKASKTQLNNLSQLRRLRKSFGSAPIDEITPQHIAQYRDVRSKKAKSSANKELFLFTHIFNMAREWGYTSKENPARGVRKNKEVPRDYYVEMDVWNAVYAEAAEELRDAMDMAYLTGQRPADVLKIKFSDIRDGAIEIQQNKTRKKLRIMLNHENQSQTELGNLIDRIRSKRQKIISVYLIATASGKPLSMQMLFKRFKKARMHAAEKSKSIELSERIKQFQFRDIRPMAATDISDIESASKLLGHTKQEMTKRVYRRKGEVAMPTK